jgi:hypothetical protein
MKQVFPLVSASSGWQWIFLLFIVVILGYLIFIIASPHKGAVILYDSSIQLQVPLYGRTIPISMLNMADSRIVDLSAERNLRLKWRTNGIGMPRYLVGWFRLYDGQKALAAVTDPHHVVYIPTRDGYSLLLSVANPNTFLSAVKAQSSESGR